MSLTNSDLVTQIRQRGALSRSAAVVRSGINTEDRTVELAFSSETDGVERWFGIEILGHTPGEMNLSRLVNGAPVLWQHDWHDQRGVVESVHVGTDRVGRAVVRFSRTPKGDEMFQDIVDGIVTKVSVGYSVEGMQLVEERGGVDVYRVTAWTPFEISMVSVAADDEVGVGRSMVGQRAAGHVLEAVPGASNQIEALFARANQPSGPHIFYNADNTVRATVPKPSGTVSRISIRSLDMPAFAKEAFREVHTPQGRASGKKTTLDVAIAKGSRSVAAGAKLVIAPAAAPATVNNGEIVFRREEVRFDAIEAGRFTIVPDAADVAASALPVHRAFVDLEYMPSLGFRVELSRADQNAYAAGQLADATLVSIALGIARAADATLLAGILATNPSGFTLAKAAASGVEFAELRALVGTAGAGAAAGQDGTLRAAGVAAELTPDSTATLVGSWARAGVAVHEEITLVAGRANLNGGLTLTCFVNMQALLPMPGMFWTVGA